MILKVNDTKIDLAPVERVLLTLSVNDFGNFESRTGGYSNKFKAPLTRNNLEVFGFPDDFTAFNDFTLFKPFPASIESKGFVIYGSVVVASIDNSINLNFFDSNSSWFEFAKTSDIMDIDFSDLNHLVDITNISDTFDLSKDYVYIPASNTPEDTEQIAIDSDNFVPALKISAVVKRAFELGNIKVKGTFVDTWDYNNLLIPFYKKERMYIVEDSLTSRNITGIATDTFPYAIVSGSGYRVRTFVAMTGLPAYLTNSDTRYQALDGSWRVRIKVDVTTTYEDCYNINGAFPLRTRVDILKNGVVIKQSTLDLQYTDTGTEFNETVVTTVEIDSLNLNTDDYIEVQLFSYFFWNGTGTPTITITNNTDSPYIVIECLELYQENQIQDFSKFFDNKVTLAKILRNLSNIFNLIFSYDIITSTLYIDQFDELVNNISLGNVVDWSHKIDIASVEQEFFASKYGKQNTLGYTKDSQNTMVPETYGQGIIPIPDAKKDIVQLFKSDFAATTSNFISDVLPYVPKLIKNVDLVPRILYVKSLGSGEVAGYDIFSRFTSSNVAQTLFPLAWFIHSSGTFVDGILFDLTFGNENPESLNLLDRFHVNTKLLLGNFKIVTADFYLTTKDISELDFLKPAYVSFFKSYFYINKIKEFDTNSDRLTNVELLKIG